MGNEEGCREILNDELCGHRVSAMLDAHPDCACEQHRSNDFSAGPIANNELIVHLIMSPIDIDPDSNKLRPDVNRDTLSHGMSCVRCKTLDEIDLDEMGRQREVLKQDKGHRYMGYVALSAGYLRGLHDTMKRAYCVYDTALETEPRHAEVMCNLKEKAKRREFQVKLWGQMNQCFSRRTH